MAKRKGPPPGRAPRDRPDDDDEPQPPKPPPETPPLGESRAEKPPEDLTESSALVIMSDSDVQKFGESRTDKPPDDLTESSALVFLSDSDVQKFESSDELPKPELEESQSVPPPADLTESSAFVLMSESDVVKFESDDQTPKPPPPPPPKKPGAKAKPPKPPGPPPRPPPPPPEKFRWGPVLLGVAIAILFSAGGATAVRFYDAAERERARAAAEDDRAEREARAAQREKDLADAADAERAARSRELERLRKEIEDMKRAAAEHARADDADRARREEDARKTDAALRGSLGVERDAAIAEAERLEKERGDRARLDLERRARETVDRYEALLKEAEARREAEIKVAQREVRAEILRREALLRKQFEEEKAALEREKTSELALETSKLEERLRAEYERDRSGFMKGPEGGGPEGEGVDLEQSVWKYLTGHLGGSLEYKLRAYVHESQPEESDANQAYNEMIAKLRYEASFFEDKIGVKVVPRVRVDDDGLSYSTQQELDDEALHRPVFTLEEAHADGHFGALDVSVGKMIFAWGTGDIYNPTDIMNPVDFSDLIESEKIGVFGLDASLYPTDATRLRAILVPTFTPARLPLVGERWNLFPEDGVTIASPVGPIGPLFLSDREFPEGFAHTFQGAFRASTSAFGWDTSFMYYAGLNPLPLIEPRKLPAPPFVDLVPTYVRIHMLGMDFATTFEPPALGEIQLHGEAGQFITEGGKDDDYLQYLVGVNKTFSDPILHKEATFILEWTGEWVNQHRTDTNVIPATSFGRPFRGALLTRLDWKPVDRLEVLVTLAALLDGPKGLYFKPEARYEIGTHTKISAGFDLLGGEKKSFFGQFDQDDRFWLSLKLTF